MERNESFASCIRNRLRSVPYAELRQDALNVRGHGIGADHEPLCDLCLVESVNQEPQDLALPWREVRVRTAKVQTALTVDPGRSRTRDQPLHTRQKLIRIERLHDVVVCTQKEAGCPIQRVHPVAGQEDDRKPLSESAAKQATQRVSRHAPDRDLQNDQVWLLLVDEAQCFVSV